MPIDDIQNKYIYNPLYSNQYMTLYDMPYNWRYNNAVVSNVGGMPSYELNNGTWVNLFGEPVGEPEGVSADGVPDTSWHLNWLGNRQLQLKNNMNATAYPGNTYNDADAFNMFQDEINNLKSYREYIPAPGTRYWKEGLAGVTEPGPREINYNPEDEEFIRHPSALIVHERTHGLDNPEAGIRGRHIPQLNMIDSIMHNTYGKNWIYDKNYTGNGGDTYTDDPAEIYARMMSIRHDANLNPNAILNVDDIEKLKDDPRVTDYDKERTLYRYDDDTLLRLFNEVAQNNTDDNMINYAAYGGNLYAKGSFIDIDPPLKNNTEWNPYDIDYDESKQTTPELGTYIYSETFDPNNPLLGTNKSYSFIPQKKVQTNLSQTSQETQLPWEPVIGEINKNYIGRNVGVSKDGYVEGSLPGASKEDSAYYQNVLHSTYYPITLYMRGYKEGEYLPYTEDYELLNVHHYPNGALGYDLKGPGYNVQYIPTHDGRWMKMEEKIRKSDSGLYTNEPVAEYIDLLPQFNYNRYSLKKSNKNIYSNPNYEFAEGGSIHINPKNRGKFNATKKRTGKTTEELTHSKNPLTRKRAIFAQNAKKWKHDDGGYLYDDNTDELLLPEGRYLLDNNLFNYTLDNIETYGKANIPNNIDWWNRTFRSPKGYQRWRLKYIDKHYPFINGDTDDGKEYVVNKVSDNLYNHNSIRGGRELEPLDVMSDNMRRFDTYRWFNNFDAAPEYKTLNARHLSYGDNTKPFGLYSLSNDTVPIEYYSPLLEYPETYHTSIGNILVEPADSFIKRYDFRYDNGLKIPYGGLKDFGSATYPNNAVIINPKIDKDDDSYDFTTTLMHEVQHTGLPREELPANAIGTRIPPSFLGIDDLENASISEYLFGRNSTEVGARIAQVLNHYGIDSKEKLDNIDGEKLEEMFYGYLEDGKMDNNITDLTERISDWDLVADWMKKKYEPKISIKDILPRSEDPFNVYKNRNKKRNVESYGGNLNNNFLNNNNMNRNYFATGGYPTDPPEPEYYAGSIPTVTIRPLDESYVAPSDATYVRKPIVNQENFYPGEVSLNRPYVNYTDVQPFDSVRRTVFDPYYSAYEDGWKYPLLDALDVEEIRRNAALRQRYNDINNAMREYFMRKRACGGNLYAEGGEVDPAMMQGGGEVPPEAGGMPPEMMGAPVPLGGGMPVPLEGAPMPEQGDMPVEAGMPPQEEYPEEEMPEEEEGQDEWEEGFWEARDEAIAEGKKTFEYDGKVYPTDLGARNIKKKSKKKKYGGSLKVPKEILPY